MQLWKLTLTYDGTPFHGWQIQPGLATIQGALAGAILHVTGETVLPQGSGRTDTGVHALGQVASFALAAAIPAENLHRALNRVLPPSIRILAVEPAPADFHARHSAQRKTYEYRIFPRRDPDNTGTSAPRLPERICSPLLAPWVWDCRWPLDLELMQQAARHILGTHDFTSFAASDPDQATRAANRTGEATPTHATNLRTIFDSTWTRRDGLLIYRVTGSGFLHHMVRNLVGTFVDAGARRIPPSAVAAILEARDRAAAGPTAPASGLFLVEVIY